MKKMLSLVLAGLLTTSAYMVTYANEVEFRERVESSVIQEQEPNNTEAQAQKIEFDTSIKGNKESGGEDYFKFYVSNDSNVEFEVLTEYDSWRKGYIYIYNSDIQLIHNEGLNNSINKINIELDKGTYYFKIGKWYGGVNDYDFNYELKVSRHYFADTQGHWAESQINKLVDLGYVGGYSDGTFKPNNSITRAEFVKILNNTFKLTNLSGKVFKDTQNHWARKDIDIAVTNGVCNGKSATEFKPNDPITREEAALMIANYKNIKDTNYDKINKFYDNKDVSSWAKDGVEGVVEKGYMGGYSDNTFKPKGKITRAEAVATLSRVK